MSHISHLAIGSERADSIEESENNNSMRDLTRSIRMPRTR